MKIYELRKIDAGIYIHVDKDQRLCIYVSKIGATGEHDFLSFALRRLISVKILSRHRSSSHKHPCGVYTLIISSRDLPIKTCKHPLL